MTLKNTSSNNPGAGTDRPVDPYPFVRRVGELQISLGNENPFRLAARTGTQFQEEQSERAGFKIKVLNQPLRITFPGFQVQDAETGKEAHLGLQGLVLYYFMTADGWQETGRWISFTELPEGRFYNQAFQNYSGRLLVERFGQDLRALDAAAVLSGGVRLDTTQTTGVPGDYAYRFQALPHLPLLIAAWEGDEDFPPAIQVLFDASAPHYLPTDVCAILGGMLARKLVKQGKN